MMGTVLIASFVVSIAALLFAWHLARQIKTKSAGTEKMQEIAEAIHKGSMAFLNKEYKILIIFMIIVAVVLWFLIPDTGHSMAIAFIVGGFFSALAGNIGMRIATKANVRTAQAASKSLNEGLRVAFSSGTVMGMTVVGLGLLGITLINIYIINKKLYDKK